MRQFSLMGLVVCSLAAGLGDATAAPSADVYGSPPDISSPSLSPDGAHIAMVRPLGDTGGVQIMAVGGQSCSFAPKNVKIRHVFWANSDRLAVEVSFAHTFNELESGIAGTFEIFRYVTVDPKCGSAVPLLADHKFLNNQTSVDYLGRVDGGKYLLFRVLNIREKERWSNIKQRDRSSRDLYKVDATTGKSELYESAPPAAIGMIVDGSGKPRIRFDQDERTGRNMVFARLSGSDDWQAVHDPDAVTDASRSLSFLHAASNSNIAYVLTRNGGDKNALYQFDLQSKGLGRLVSQHPRVDIDGLEVDEYSGQAVGASFRNDYFTQDFFDRSYAQMLADLSATFPGEAVSISSVSADKKRLIAFAEGAQNPTGVYHYVDFSVPEMSVLGARYPAVTAADIGLVKAISYNARDGLSIPAYLTLPPGSAGKNLPLVVLPHGGPAARDTASFDYEAQFYASRGYAVLQPQFRGSEGFGARHESAGHFKWGLEMQNDITDGVKHLVANGTADGSKVCIVGASYGGYAALAGLAFTPDLYKCGVSVAGVSDLLLFVGDLKRDSAYSIGGYSQSWREFIGDPVTDRDRLLATSPAKHADRIKAPLLLIHGKDDVVVSYRHTVVMAGAMKEAGKPVDVVTLDGEDHWLSKASMRKRVLSEIERFLAKHLK